MIRSRTAYLRHPFFWWTAVLLVIMLLGVIAAFLVFTQGLSVTNLSDLVPWGLWITIDLSSVALSAGAFTLSAAVYLLGLKQFKGVARTAVYVGLIGYSMACMMLLLDIGRPDRFWHGFVFWNIHSPLWEVTMCVGLYFMVLMLEAIPIIGRSEIVQTRWPRASTRMLGVHKVAPVLALVGLGLSMLHQSSLGATYGILKARPVWYQPGLAVLFMISAIIGGLALTALLSQVAAAASPRAVVEQSALDRIARFVGWALLAYLYMRFWDMLSVSYTYDPARSEAVQLLTTGPLALNFWIGEIGLGILVPIVLLLVPPFRGRLGYQTLALLLVVGGVVAYRWDINLVGQLVVVTRLPHIQTPLYTHYVPSLVEVMAGAGVVAFGLLAFSLGVRYLRVVEHEPWVSAESEPTNPMPESLTTA